jgi:hypothetical protein
MQKEKRDLTTKAVENTDRRTELSWYFACPQRAQAAIA